MDFTQRKNLIEEARKFTELSRRGLLAGAAVLGAGAAALGSSFMTPASAQEFEVPKTGKKVRVVSASTMGRSTNRGGAVAGNC